jgi:Sec-independent protein secretion pathway component TatC
MTLKVGYFVREAGSNLRRNMLMTVAAMLTAAVSLLLLGGVLTPSTDPFTQLLLAGPLYALYNLSIVVVWLMERTRARQPTSP